MPMEPSFPETVRGRVENPSHIRVAWAWLASFLPTYRPVRRPSPYEAPLVLATARAWWQRAVAAVTMAALVMAQTPARAESPLPAGCFYYHLADHLGSSSVLTDRTGAVVQQFENGVFGREVYEHNSTTHQVSARYTGQLFDEETGLYYYGARYYDPELGRFTQADTIVPDPGDGQSLNRYSYVNNNPLKYTDPSGHAFWGVFIWTAAVVMDAAVKGAAIGAAVGATVAAATGGDIGQGALGGAIGGAFTAVGNLWGTLGALAGTVLGGAVSASALGGDPGLGALSAAVGSAVSFGVGAMIGGWQIVPDASYWAKILNPTFDYIVSAVSGAGGGALAAAMTGGSEAQAAIHGAVAGAVSYAVTVDIGDLWAHAASGDTRPHAWVDTLLDVVGIGYTVYQIATGVEGVGLGDLALDIGGAIIPGAPSPGGLKAAGAAARWVGGKIAARTGKYVEDFPTKATKNWSAAFKSEGEARALARAKLGSNPVEVAPGKWRSADGKWQYRAKPGDVAGRHIHLEELNPKTGEIIQNLHLRWPEGGGR